MWPSGELLRCNFFKFLWFNSIRTNWVTLREIGYCFCLTAQRSLVQDPAVNPGVVSRFSCFLGQPNNIRVGIRWIVDSDPEYSVTLLPRVTAVIGSILLAPWKRMIMIIELLREKNESIHFIHEWQTCGRQFCWGGGGRQGSPEPCSHWFF